MDRFHIGCYWGPRLESIELCSKKINQTLLFLQKTHLPYFEQWYRLGRSKKSALKDKVDFSEENLIKSLAARKDDLFPNLGYNLSIWNGKEDGESIGFNVCCSSTSDKISNNINFNLPVKGDTIDHQMNFDTIYTIVKNLIKIWQPEWARVEPYNVRDIIPENTKIGWITYFSEKFQNEQLVSHPVFDDNFKSYGDFLIVSKDMFSTENITHMNKLRMYIENTKFKY
jgi:hypothetical protein